MSTIKTLSKFFYGTSVNRFNWSIDFDEGSGEIQATLIVGNYSLSEYCQEVQRAMRAAGSLQYIVSLDRNNRKITISAESEFDLLINTGARSATTAYGMMGADLSQDKSGSDSYEMDFGCGFEYRPQYYISSYIKKDHSFELEDSSVSSTPIGYSQVASFGDGSRTPMNIRLITNKSLKNQGFVNNPNGESDFMSFIKSAMKKSRIEFVPDINEPNNFVKCFLESTPEDGSARKFSLKNMAVDIYESGILVFREVLI